MKIKVFDTSLHNAKAFVTKFHHPNIEKTSRQSDGSSHGRPSNYGFGRSAPGNNPYNNEATTNDATLAIFTLSNTLRVLAYLPQIAKAAADRNGVVAVSFATWGLFLLANMSSV